jgi:archaellum component FlaD/FlaE
MTDSTPFLDTDGTAEHERVLMLRWGEYLIDRLGTVGALEALLWYGSNGYISDRVASQMTEYIADMEPEQVSETPDPSGELVTRLEDGVFAVHAGSLEFIAKIAGDDLDVELLALASPYDRIKKQSTDD